ncbi:MAG: NAD-dependent epimerase/dehydratase family protein [Chloroflexi bacterium]|nr:NAD-dependent epimerase/dehydratase family protein [Chloroflexota bacterium]
MKVLVTGGAGFIGSHIVDALVQLGHDVVVVDDLSTGKRAHVNPTARFYELDIRSPHLEEVFAKERPEVVSHQAARANVRESMEKPLLYADVNILGSLNLLENCRACHVRKVIYASTGGAVYGEPQYLPVDETHPINPSDPYGASKHHIEHYLYLYRLNYGLAYTALRYPNVYGPRQDPYGEAGVVAIFTRRMLRGEQVVVNGSGEQERDFVYVSDVIRANLLAIGKGDGGIYNIGSSIGTSVNEIFQRLKEITGYRLDPVHGPPKQGEVSKVYLDGTKARRELGWEAQTDLNKGLSLTVTYFRADFASDNSATNL